jgi:hypothetical protein
MPTRTMRRHVDSHLRAVINSFAGVFFIRLSCLLLTEFIIFSVASGAMQFSGIVVDSAGRPIDKAAVRLQGTLFSTFTDPAGHFIIGIDKAVSSKYITAWKDGYYNGGQPVSAEGTEYFIRLAPVRKEDNGKYAWRSSLYETSTGGKAEVKPCRQCHADLTEQWRKSTHGSSAKNPLFLAFFSGTDIHGAKGFGPGYKTDFPNSNGNCATCHVPAMALNNPFNSDPREACGVSSEGVFCDFCHKIDDVRIDNSGGYPGTLSLRFNRPAEGHQVFYGPHDDVFPGDDSYHPLYRESRYCASCHNGKFWDVLMYSEFKEWAESSYSARKVQCQDCHMASTGRMTRFATEKEGSVERSPETISSHDFRGIGDRAFMTEAIELNVRVEQKDNDLIVTAAVKNVKAGHHYPTGNPMRNMVLLVEVSGGNGLSLPLVSGERVPAWGGIGPVEKGNYAGLPGKGFAKVLRDFIPYPDSQAMRHFRPGYPAPHWRPSMIESDTRIPANGVDISRYEYSVPADMSGPIRVVARLIYRRSYKNWLDAKDIVLNDMELARMSLTVGR